MSLKEYNKKRDFKSTPEPRGVAEKANKNRFVISRHQARRLHYDFRLEMGGVLKSWAVPKGPSMNSADKRFAVMTEDHPIKYLTFKGVIPEGHYGAGVMEIWDRGKYMAVDGDMNPISDRAAAAALKQGELKIFLKGEQIQGGYVLIRLKNDDRNWLLIKHNDEFNIRKPYDAEKHKPVVEVKAGRSKEGSVKKKPASSIKKSKASRAQKNASSSVKKKTASSTAKTGASSVKKKTTSPASKKATSPASKKTATPSKKKTSGK